MQLTDIGCVRSRTCKAQRVQPEPTVIDLVLFGASLGEKSIIKVSLSTMANGQENQAPWCANGVLSVVHTLRRYTWCDLQDAPSFGIAEAWEAQHSSAHYVLVRSNALASLCPSVLLPPCAATSL